MSEVVGSKVAKSKVPDYKALKAEMEDYQDKAIEFLTGKRKKDRIVVQVGVMLCVIPKSFFLRFRELGSSQI